MKNCQHEVGIEFKDDGTVVSFCTKCGEILSVKKVPKSADKIYDEQTKNSNGGQILWD